MRRWQRQTGAPEAVSGAGVERFVPALPRVVAIGYALVALWWTGAVLAAGDIGPALRVGAWLTGIGVILYGLLWRPEVRVDDAGVQLRNVLRDVRVPWAALDGVDTRYALTLQVDGAAHRSWAAAAPARPSGFRAGLGAAGPGRRSTASPAAGAATTPAARSGGPGVGTALPDPRWTGGEGATMPASRDLRGDAGAAAFLVERRRQAWQGSPGRDTEGASQAQVSWNRGVLAALALSASAVMLIEVLARQTTAI